MMKRGDRTIVAIDLETGGFNPVTDALLMIGCYWTDFRGSARGLLTRVSRGEKRVKSEAAAICGYIDDEQWDGLGALPVGPALDRLICWLQGMADHTGGTLELVAHNVGGVDRPFLEQALREQGLMEEVFGETVWLVSHAWHDSMFTMRACQTAGLVPLDYGASLNALMMESGQGAQLPIHNALSDAEGCFRGYHWLLQQMQGRLL